MGDVKLTSVACLRYLADKWRRLSDRAQDVLQMKVSHVGNVKLKVSQLRRSTVRVMDYYYIIIAIRIIFTLELQYVYYIILYYKGLGVLL